MATIILPKSTAELILLGQKIINKHKGQSENKNAQSILISLYIKDLDQKLEEVKPKYQDMLRLKEKLDQLNDQLKRVCGTHGSNRKISPGTIKFNIANVRDILKAVHREDLNQLCDWGFKVIERIEKTTMNKRR